MHLRKIYCKKYSNQSFWRIWIFLLHDECLYQFDH